MCLRLSMVGKIFRLCKHRVEHATTQDVRMRTGKGKDCTWHEVKKKRRGLPRYCGLRKSAEESL